MGGLIGTASETKDGLMSKNMYNVGVRREIELSSDNVQKCVNIGTITGIYRRGMIRINGFYEGECIDCYINLRDSSGQGNYNVSIKTLLKSTSVQFYKKINGSTVDVFAKSNANRGNDCFITISHFGSMTNNNVGQSFEPDDSFEEIV